VAASNERRVCRALGDEGRAGEIEDQLHTLDAAVTDLASALGELTTADLLTLSFPGPRQFEKYWEGGGAGQAQ
jgi:hypothetical protein